MAKAQQTTGGRFEADEEAAAMQSTELGQGRRLTAHPVRLVVGLVLAAGLVALIVLARRRCSGG